MRTSKRHFRLSAFSMHGHHDRPFVPLMLMPYRSDTLARSAIFETLRFPLLCSPVGCDVVHARGEPQAIIDAAIILARDGIRPHA